MIKWANQMYYDESASKRKRLLKWAIRTGGRKWNYYCICLSTNPESLLDIIPVAEFRFPYYKNQEIYALGLARGKYHACELVRDMIDEVYQNTGGVKVRDYYRDRWDEA